jgi:hypothetical protein
VRIFHVRTKLARRGGNSFYRDRSVRESTTLCGAPCTLYDAKFDRKDKVRTWTDNVETFLPCAACTGRKILTGEEER